MKIITLEEAIRHLEEASAVIWETDQRFLVYPSTTELSDSPDSEWMHLKASDDEGYDYAVYFIRQNNEQVRVEGSRMYLEDNEGDEICLTLLTPMQLEDKVRA